MVLPGTYQKLNPEGMRFIGGRSALGWESLFLGKLVQVEKAAGQLKTCMGSVEWLVEPPDSACEPEPENEQLPPRTLRTPGDGLSKVKLYLH